MELLREFTEAELHRERIGITKGNKKPFFEKEEKIKTEKNLTYKNNHNPIM